jgi:hypothetical protein
MRRNGIELEGHGKMDEGTPRCECGERFDDAIEFARHCQEVERRRSQPGDAKHTVEMV